VEFYSHKGLLILFDEDIIKELIEFNFTRNQAKLYLSLLFKGRASAVLLSNMTGIPREETYRLLKKMEANGVVEATVGRPVRYVPVTPHAVLPLHLVSLEEKRKTLQSKMDNVLRRLQSILYEQPEGENPDAKYSMTTGRKRGYSILQDLCSTAQREILYATSRNGLSRLFKVGLDSVLRNRAAKGIDIRIATDIDAVNLNECKQLMGACQLRHLPQQCSHLNIFDKETLMVGIVYNDEDLSINSGSVCDLVTNAPDFVSMMITFFESLWNDSIDAKARIGALDEGRLEPPTHQIGVAI
jgi:sugar-specific transcriptional regulator TrmB